jgi:hypothetical protein
MISPAASGANIIQGYRSGTNVQRERVLVNTRIATAEVIPHDQSTD